VLFFQDLGSIGPDPAQQTSPAGIAQRELAISPVEPAPRGGESINVRRDDDRIAIAGETGVEVIRGDE